MGARQACWVPPRFATPRPGRAQCAEVAKFRRWIADQLPNHRESVQPQGGRARRS